MSNLASHVEWMHDAVAIEFVGDREQGVGTTFDCDTKVGPFRLTDRMEITSWKPSREMGVRHRGLVTGTGRFTLTAVGEPDEDGRRRPRRRSRRRRERTRFVWTERLRFPWYMGGPLGALVARPVLRRIWKKNLKNLRARFA